MVTCFVRVPGMYEAGPRYRCWQRDLRKKISPGELSQAGHLDARFVSAGRMNDDRCNQFSQRPGLSLRCRGPAGGLACRRGPRSRPDSARPRLDVVRPRTESLHERNAEVGPDEVRRVPEIDGLIGRPFERGGVVLGISGT